MQSGPSRILLVPGYEKPRTFLSIEPSGNGESVFGIYGNAHGCLITLLMHVPGNDGANAVAIRAARPALLCRSDRVVGIDIARSGICMGSVGSVSAIRIAIRCVLKD